MEAIMKQIQHQLKQKQEQKAALLRQLETINKEEEQLQQTIHILTAQVQPEKPSVKPEASKAATTASSSQSPSPVHQEVSSDTEDTKKKTWFEICEEEENKAKKWYVIFNGPNKGVYNDWGIANSYIKGKNVTHKSYKTRTEAENAFKEAYKTVTVEDTQKSPLYTTLPKTPIKPVNLPQSLNQLHAKAALAAIPTTKEKELMKKPTPEKFAKLWDSLVSYTEVHSLMGFYPVIRRPGPKAIFLGNLSDAMTLWEYFTHGFIDTIYITGHDLHCFNEFPTTFQNILKAYKTRFAKERDLFIKLYSSYPFFDEESQLLVPSITHAYLGVSNGSKPTKDELPHEAPTENHLILALAGVYLASSRIGLSPDQRSKVRINYCSKTLLVYSVTETEITAEGLKAIERFEAPFEKFSQILAELPTEVKKQLCRHIRHAPRHNCNYCEENQEDTPFTEMEDIGE
jgi:hypothetical protein